MSDNENETRERYVLPEWVDSLRPVFAVLLLGIAPVYAIALVWYGFSPKTTDVGYQPQQPVPFSHALHAGELGLDCRYCHTTVEKAAFAAVPPTDVCMGCHTNIKPMSDKLAAIRESHDTGLPVPWVRVHDLPDYVYFNHSAHVSRGVSCVECHGRVDRMEVVYQKESLSMGWCLDCHRNPDARLRPVEFVTQLDWVPDEDPASLGARIRSDRDIDPSQDCSVCHR
ncbi:MAG: cytochrome c3 family protein [Acidobacteriota bacterium]|nr:cytochrome c3 family protein [Acidobacteriota bacterium]